MDRPREIVARGFDRVSRRVRREVKDIIVRFTPEYAADQLGLGPRQGRHLGRLIKAFSLGSIKRDRESGASWQQEYDRESPQHSDIDPCVELYIDMSSRQSGASGDKDTSILPPEPEPGQCGACGQSCIESALIRFIITTPSLRPRLTAATQPRHEENSRTASAALELRAEH